MFVLLQTDVSRETHGIVRNWLYIILTLRHGARAGLFSRWKLKEFQECKYDEETNMFIGKVCNCIKMVVIIHIINQFPRIFHVGNEVL